MNDSIWSHNAIRSWIGLHDLELHGSHSPSHDEGVPLVDGSVCLQEVGLQVDLEPVSWVQGEKRIFRNILEQIKEGQGNLVATFFGETPQITGPR